MSDTSTLFERVIKLNLGIQDRATFYAVVLHFLKERVGRVAFDEDVEQAIQFLRHRKEESNV